MKSSVADDEETGNNNNNNNTVLHRQSSFSCCSEDESNVSSYDIYGLASSDNSKGVSLPNGKSRANRGSATDPQSLYARVSINCIVIHVIQIHLKMLVFNKPYSYYRKEERELTRD